MLKLTNAWRTTGGECYESKAKAFNAEILHLYRSLPKWDGKHQIVSNQIKKGFRFQMSAGESNFILSAGKNRSMEIAG